MDATVVVTNWVPQQVLDYLETRCRVVPNDKYEPLSRAEMLVRARDADALLVFMTDLIDGELLAASTRLRIVACAAKGHNNIDVKSCTKRGIWVTNSPDLLTAPTAELAIGLMIALARKIPVGDRSIRMGHFLGWRPAGYGRSVDGSVVGILGAGVIGKAIAQRLGGFQCELLYFDKKRLDPDQEQGLKLRYVPLAALLSKSDFVFVAIPLDANSFHLINATFLRQMKVGTYLINTARGSIVDERAVAEALENGHLAGYAADVFEMEDYAIATSSRSIYPKLVECSEQTVFTPHLGSLIASVRLDIAMEAARNILQVLEGCPPDNALNAPSNVGGGANNA